MKVRTIQATARVTPDGTLTARVPQDVTPGEHQVVIIVEDSAPLQATRPALGFPVDHIGAWPSDLSLRREDLYGDAGR